MFYPLSKVTIKYTPGGEIQFKKSSSVYKGFYYETFDGKFFAGKEPRNGAEELVLIKPKVNNNTTKGPILENINPFKIDNDNVERYFVMKVNDMNFLEVNRDTYLSLKNNVLYRSVSILWRVRGSRDIVIEMNRRASIEANKKLPGVSFLINDYLKYFAD